MAALDFPASPVNGQIYDPGTGTLYQWNGAQWDVYTGNKQGHAETRNRITNPAMQISQEYGETATTTASTYPADQWLIAGSLPGLTSTRASVGLTPSGNRFQLSCGAAQKASLAAADIMVLITPIEGLNVVDFRYGFSFAKQAVLRFAVYAPVAGTYCVAVFNHNYSRSGVFEYVIVPADVSKWVVREIVIPGDTIGTWQTDGVLSIMINFVFAAGSTHIGVPGWQVGGKYATANQVNIYATATAAAYISDVGLYLDPDGTGKAPPFEIPDYGEELRRCQRYWEVTGMTIATTPADYSNTTWYKATKRTPPTLAVIAGAIGTGQIAVVTYAPLDGYRQTAGNTAVDIKVSANARLV